MISSLLLAQKKVRKQKETEWLAHIKTHNKKVATTVVYTLQRKSRNCKLLGYKTRINCMLSIRAHFK